VPKLTHGPLVGATTHHSVMIWLRADDDCHSEIRVAKEHNDLPEKYIARGSTILKETKDFTGVIEFTGLEPDTHYSYCVFLDGELALSNSLFPSPSFQTFPLPNQHAPDFSFAFGSCFIPQRYQDKIFNQIAERSSTQKNSVSNLRFFIMLGDNVYVDEYVKDICEKKKIDCPSVAEYYKGAYRDTWKYKNFRRALSQLSTYMIFDDHEFWDNWGNIDPNDPPSKHYDAEHDEHAKQTYQIYQDSHNPDYQSRHTNNKNQYFYKFGYGNVGFFVLDCRTERKADEKIMLGVEQWHALFEWLLDTKDNYAVKFIVSSVPITFIGLPHWLINKFHEKLGDQWLGYTKERLRLFEFIQKNKIQGVHFLSGDIHLGQAIVIRSKFWPKLSGCCQKRLQPGSIKQFIHWPGDLSNSFMASVYVSWPMTISKLKAFIMNQKTSSRL